jgi:hypothetical protein
MREHPGMVFPVLGETLPGSGDVGDAITVDGFGAGVAGSSCIIQGLLVIILD